MRDAFPPPIVVVEIVYVFRLCGIVCRWLMSFGWIVRKRLFCLCGMCGKILRSVVGAVPVCPPASPCKGAFVVHPPRTMRMFLVWKRRYAGVRAGTQAPPLWFRLDGLCMGRLMPFGWITRKWIMEFGRSGYRCTHLFRPVKGTFHYFLKNRLARWMASLNWRGLMWKLGMGLRWLSVTSMVPSGCFVMMVSPPMMKP